MGLVKGADGNIRSYEPFHKERETKEKLVTPFEEVLLRPGRVEEKGTTSETEIDVLKHGDVDSVIISQEAKTAYELERIVRIVRKAPDVRHERLAELRERMKNGGLVVKKVIEAVAERLRNRLMGKEEDKGLEILVSPESTANAIADWLIR